jgi:hypothetical protein
MLQYLLPPTAPIPTTLLSRELLQRHHFLRISPDDPAAYFCWPSFGTSSATSVIQDLEMRAGNEALLNKEVHDITYEHDKAGSRARVKLTDDLDLYVLFIWQGSNETGSLGDDGWKYYDMKRIPSSTSARRVYGHKSWSPMPNPEIPSLGNEGPYDLPLTNGGDEYSRASSPSSDAYWDNYGMH